MQHNLLQEHTDRIGCFDTNALQHLLGILLELILDTGIYVCCFSHIRQCITFVLHVKLVGPIAMEEQIHFAIRLPARCAQAGEGGKTVGAGVVTKIVA